MREVEKRRRDEKGKHGADLPTHGSRAEDVLEKFWKIFQNSAFHLIVSENIPSIGMPHTKTLGDEFGMISLGGYRHAQTGIHTIYTLRVLA